MNKTKIGIFFTLLLVLGVCSSCGEKKSNNKLVLNEDGGTIESDPSEAGTDAETTNPNWNITEETVTPTEK